MAERKKYSEELKAIVLLTCSLLHLNIHTEQSQVFDKQSNKI